MYQPQHIIPVQSIQPSQAATAPLGYQPVHTGLGQPAYQLPLTQQLLQPVPVPTLPDLTTDSEREFTDLKMALDNLLGPHTELSEHYNMTYSTSLPSSPSALQCSDASPAAPVWPTPSAG